MLIQVTLFGMTVESATTEELKSLMKPLGSPPPNPKFVFHNKIPKAGSTTMKWLLVALARKNGFRLDHARWCLSEGRKLKKNLTLNPTRNLALNINLNITLRVRNFCGLKFLRYFKGEIH